MCALKAMTITVLGWENVLGMEICAGLMHLYDFLLCPGCVNDTNMAYCCDTYTFE